MKKSIWYLNENSLISISGKSDHSFTGYYKKYPLEDNDYQQLPDFNNESDVQYCEISFNQIGYYLIKIVNNTTDEIKEFMVEVREKLDQTPIIDEIKNLKNLTSFKIDDLKTSIMSDETGIVKVINDIQNLPDGTKLDQLLSKIDQLQLQVNNLKNKTVAFINNG